MYSIVKIKLDDKQKKGGVVFMLGWENILWT